MCDMSHSYMENHSFMYLDRLNMGRQRFLGSLKMYVSFANEPYKNRGSLAKKTYILKEPTKRWHPIFFVKCYGVAMVCRLPKLSGLFCKKNLQNKGSFPKETWQLMIYIYLLGAYKSLSPHNEKSESPKVSETLCGPSYIHRRHQSKGAVDWARAAPTKVLISKIL